MSHHAAIRYYYGVKDTKATNTAENDTVANIEDYLRWRGDVSFAEHPFNDVDNLILSTMAYLEFQGIVPSEEQGGGITVAEACNQLLTKAQGDIQPFVCSLTKIEASFVEALAKTTRFGKALLSAYVNEIDPRRALQFAALQIDLPHAGTYVAYRGTDSTLVGWRENFMLSFTVTAAQREATLYLERVIMRTDPSHCNILVGGHSKGGNLAEYAATSCPEHLRTRIVRVYSNDGPRMAPEVCLPHAGELPNGIFRHIVPTYSVIGMIFCPEDDPRIVVESSESGIEQHDPISWQVTPNGLKEAHALQPDCMVVNRTIASWVKDLSLEERERATQEIFDALQAGGATRLKDITASPEGLQQVLRALRSTDKRVHGVAMALVQSAMNTSVAAVRESALKTMVNVGRRLLTERS